MSGKQNSFLKFFKRARKNPEGAPGTLLSSTKTTDDVQEDAGSPLGPSRSEAWPWMSAATNERPHTAPAMSSSFALSAARSESWPWATPSPKATSRPATPASDVQSNYLEVLQTASSRGYQAPPRHEVSEYQHKALPLPPPICDPASDSASTHSSTRQSRQPTMPSSRLSMAMNAADVDEHEAQIYQSEFVSPQLKWQARNHMVSSHQPTWISRLERRAEGNKQGRELLVKKAEPNVPEHDDQ